MVNKTKPISAMIFTITIILTFSYLVHSTNLLTSPSPAPEREPVHGSGNNLIRGRNIGKAKRWSFPAECQSKCNQCKPCMPVEISVRGMELEENEYYPQVWKCMCNDSLFSP